MTLKVTISVEPGASWAASVHVQDAQPNNGPQRPVERFVVGPGMSHEFSIHAQRSLYVHEQQLSAG